VDTHTLFVDAARGSDAAGTGAAQRPFKTVGKALATVADIRKQAPTTGTATVVLNPGVYHEHVVVTPAHSGPNGENPVVITGASPPEPAVGATGGGGGGTATISGGVALTGLVWKPATEYGRFGRNRAAAVVYKAALTAALPLGGFTGLFGNGKRLTRARYPNCDDITGTSCYTLNSTGGTGQVAWLTHWQPFFAAHCFFGLRCAGNRALPTCVGTSRDATCVVLATLPTSNEPFEF
jgi:hypothetical protein